MMVNYASDAIMYTCTPGYSAIDEDDVWTPNKNRFSLTCRADGTFSPPLACININDCMVQSCGNFGSCKDFPNPTGVHFDDYECVCKPGYEQTLTDSSVNAAEQEKLCTNINDCPRENVCGGQNPSSMMRGACEDKLIDYDCLCSSGYEVTKLPTLPDNDTCTPVHCGLVPPVSFATTPTEGAETDYETLPWTYTCIEGYTLDGVATGAKTTVKYCTSGATIASGPETCLPVNCGTTRSAPHADMSPPLIDLHYDEELTYTGEVGYTMDAQVGGTNTFNVNCLSNGTQTPLLRCLPVECGIPEPATGSGEFASYVPSKVGTLVFKEIARIVCDLGYSLDQTAMPASAEYEVTCLSNGTFGYLKKCKPVLCGVPRDVMFATKSVSNQMVFPETVEYSCNHGYSLSGNITGETAFEVSCQANATFSPVKECLPVSCGRSPRLENASYPGTSHVYLERALYRCLEGFSTDGTADGPKSFALNCAGTAEYVGLNGCKPIECGAVQKRDFAKQVAGPNGLMLGDLVYAQVAVFECLPGYATDGTYMSTKLTSVVRCQADGTMTNPSQCRNIDDCQASDNHCSQDGHCVDKDEPTGVHIDDFHCACNSGFAENISAIGARYCYNIPDCPLTPNVACLPGTCHDLVNNYYCTCPTGYYEGRNMEEGLSHDCLPVHCGAPPTVRFGSTPTTADQYFDMPRLNYTCDTGYTLDGTAAGVNTFSLTCQADRSFSSAPACLPVACGAAPHVSNASYPAGPKVFPEQVPYECHAGYSLDATFAGVSNKRFGSECQADGTFAPVQPCLAIRCPAIEKQAHTVNDDSGTVLAFPARVQKSCMAGYALNQHQHGDIRYSIFCNEQGELVGGGAPSNARANWRQCVPINCGSLPTIGNGRVLGSRLYGESATATCNSGFSVDRTVAPSSATYVTRCQTNGEYTAHPDCLAVSCGSAPFVTKTTRSDEGEKFYRETVTYTLDVGYTLNGRPNGPRQFTVRCQNDGNFSATSMPHPVMCGPSPSKEHATFTHSTRTYLQEEAYHCMRGFSVDGAAWEDGGISTFNLTCYEDGRYYWDHGNQHLPHSDASCQRVNCGVAEAPAFTNPIQGATSEKRFQAQAGFRCRPGYSLNGTLAGATRLEVTCRANGTFTPHPGCINKDDCEGNACVPHGRCVDFEHPTGNHLSDYTCECDSGYELRDDERTGEHLCGNIPDCPEGACLPGSCEDLVNDYQCHCPAGYYEGENAAREWPHDCLPVSCGNPPTVQHATTAETTRDVFFASKPVPYTCDEGYSLDAAPLGEKEFELKCLADMSFSAQPVCLPVECGLAPTVDNAGVDDAVKTFVFGEKPAYTCAEGYSVGGEASAPAEFEAECDAEGNFLSIEACTANGCPVPSGPDPFGPHALYDQSALPIVYPNNLLQTCLPGYALPEPVAAGAAVLLAAAPVRPKAAPTKLQHVMARLTSRRLKANATKVDSRARMFEARRLQATRAKSHHSVNRSAAGSGVNAHLSILDATVAHSNLNGLGPDTGMQELRFAGVGSADGHQIDLVITVSPNYEKQSNSGIAGGGFGKINIKVCIESEFTFMFVDHATDQPVTLNTFDITFFDLDASSNFMKTETLRAYGYDRMYTHISPWYTATQTADGGEMLTATHVAVPNPQGPMTLSEAQMQASVAFRYVNTDHFRVALGSTCNGGGSNGGRNFQFSFESAMVPQRDVTYLATCQADGTFAIPADLCEPIDCGEAPTVEHGTVTGGTKYGELLVVTAAEGYSLDATDSPSAKTYNITCQETGEFTAVHAFTRISCGAAPDMEHQSKDSGSEKAFEDVVRYSLNEGYTLNGQSNGDASYDITCQAEGTFTSLSSALPVECGTPPELNHASTPDTTYTYGLEAPYNCAGGHTVDGTASAPSTFEVMCGADGTFGSPSGCEPIRCGAVSVPEHTEQLPDAQGDVLAELHFGRVATFKCLPGFSKDGVLYSTDLEYNVTCPPTGQLVYPATCQNMGDCASRENMCLSHGSCVDSTNPTGDHFSDFSCSCDSGFSEEIIGGAKTCVNIDDCPPNACDPGSCIDQVNAYECDCPLGYRVGNGPSCTPVSCGTPGPVTNAHFSDGPTSGAELFYTRSPVEYTCNEGYSLDASPVGETSFNVSCQATGTLEPPETCLPVTCGKAPMPNFTQPSFHEDREFIYLGTGSYTCLQGYTLDGDAAGVRTFEATCQADGLFRGIEVCQPVRCPVPTTRGMVDPTAFGANAVYNDVHAMNFLYPQEMVVTCMAGYEVSGGHDTTYNVSCEASGTFRVPAEQCTPISCGDAPCVAHAEVTGSTYFTGALTATAKEGYSLDGSTASAARTTTFQCQASGLFSTVRTFQKIGCGLAPDVEHSESAELIEGPTPDECAAGAGASFFQKEMGPEPVKHKLTSKSQRMVRGLTVRKVSSQKKAAHRRKANNTARMARTALSPLFGDTVRYTCQEGYHAKMREGNVLPDDPTRFEYECRSSGDIEITGPDGIVGAECVPVTCPIRPAGPEASLFLKTASGGDWHSTQCDAGQTVIGGGCNANSGPWLMQYNGPDGVDKWRCGGQGGGKTVWAICSSQLSPEVVTVEGGDWTTVTCPAGKKILSGGCNARSSPHRYQKSAPEGDAAWTCGGSGASKTVWATCSAQITPAIVQEEGGDWHTVHCPRGLKVIGGGCDAHVHPWVLQYNGPDGDSAWRCGGQGGRKMVWAICAEINDAAPQFPNLNARDTMKRDFGQTVPMLCGEGFSLDGTPTGEVTFEESCMETGRFSSDHTCSDINWCLISRCGDHGTCVDGMTGYTCECERGFVAAVEDGHLETCIQVDECATWSGTVLCGGQSGAMGTCTDETLNYTCSCSTGHENDPLDDGRDVCVPITCEALPARPHATTHLAGQKLSYEGTASYVCDNGYSLDGTANGGADFEVTCEADKSLSGFQECRAVDCGAVPTVQDASANATGLKFGEIAKYTCASDHTLSGMATGTTEFDVGCTAGGSLTETYSCHLISCGVPPRIPNAGAANDEVHVGGTAEIGCVEGYTLDGGASSAATFSISCQSNGSFTGVQSCVKVNCGVPQKIENSQMPVGEYFYLDQFDVLCHSGYTVDHTPTGSDTFMVSCQADGTFAGMGECLPVSCGTPSGTSSADYGGGELFLLESANFTCKAGYSTTGTKVGQDWYIKTCQASGLFGRESPGPCIDIDYCATNPCGANGMCTDSGVGIPAPGYSCSCLEGYEVTTRDDGGETCSADDCTGNPCGAGGTCTDLSAQGGPQGAYQCNCEAGYDLVEPEPGRSTCERAVCGPAPRNIQDVERDGRSNMPIIHMQTYSGRVHYDAMSSAPILKSFDSGTYTCADGYSTDGLVGDQSKTFTVSCLGSGTFSRVLQPTLECQPVQCSNYQNLRMPNSHILNQQSMYVYGQSIRYECATGHTLDGRVGGQSSYEVPCRADGTFPDRQASCIAIECPVSSRPSATHDAGTGRVPFGRSVTYSCISGYEIGGNGSTTYVGTCEASGDVSFPFGLSPCEPVSCGMITPVTNAELLIAGGRGMLMPMQQGYEGVYGGPTIRVQCEEGMTLGGIAGGATFYTMSCGPDKAYSATASGLCSIIRYAVGGLLTDAQSPSIRLEDAEVTIRSQDGRTVFATARSASSGIYWVDLPAGAFTFTAAKEGYITSVRNITIAGYTSTGGAADMALSQVLGEGEWRVVVEWAAHSRDIDSHTYWNNNAAHVYWSRPSVNDHASGIHVTLDRDATNGFGPETTTLAGIGRCNVYSQCLIKFEIDNYSDEDAPLGASGVHVKLYHGASLDSEYTIPECVGALPRGQHWPVFTLDARAGRERAYPGLKRLPPYMQGTGEVDWSQTFDTQMWSMASPGALLTGFRAQALASGGRIEDAPVYTHISLFDSTVTHSNLGGQGPDSGAEELTFHRIGEAGGRTFDLVITKTGGTYERLNTNGFSGRFGKINMRGCQRADFDFHIVDAATGAPVTIASFDVTFFDFDDWRRHRNYETLTISGYDEMITHPEPWYTVTTQRDGGVTIDANHQNVPNPSDPMRLSSDQMQASVAFSFRNRAGFHANLGSICGTGRSRGGRNLMFSFDSAISPPDPGYQTALQYLHQIQYVSTIRVGGLQSEHLDCQQVDLDLTSVGWAECPDGRFLDGLYRVGSRYSEGEGVHQINRASCCKAAELPNEWGECHEQDVFRDVNVLYQCTPATNGRPTAMVGLHRGATHETLDDLDKIKCCGFVQIGLLPGSDSSCTQTR
jgi:hypothetical protein